MRTLLFIVIAISTIACNKEPDRTPDYRTRKCNTRPLYPYFLMQYYSLEDVDTIVIKKFEDDGTFTQLISETIYDTSDIVTLTAHDYLPDGFSIEDGQLDYGYAYQIVIASTSQTYTLSGLPLTTKIDTFDANSNNGHSGECWEYEPVGTVTGGKYLITTFGKDPGYGGYHLALQGQ